jgi:hypothetical protein
MKNLLKRAITPVSIALLLTVAAVAPFTILRNAAPITIPPILDPNFQLWLGNASERHLVVWRTENVTAGGDSLSIAESTWDQVTALKFNLLKKNMTAPTYEYVSQEIDGSRLTALFTYNISAWIMKQSCTCNLTTPMGSEMFGLEVNDGRHVLTFMFSQAPAETKISWSRRVIFVQSATDRWVRVPLEIAKQYSDAHWDRPDKVVFGVFFGSDQEASGSLQAYVHNFTWSTGNDSQMNQLAPSISSQIGSVFGNLPLLMKQAVFFANIGNSSKDLTTVPTEGAAGCP